ncbi:NUDIX hydrolase [Loigolactobacillus backii]|uniref:NUDIX hydrolase n=1 Tax=Loigolactobacillus backii TaxID=375175 RepID=A0A192H0H1_9LACO|nr:NUDIX domain-containing protein [Loigolactobacillus backii]ANK60270.1 NUDIX hydrolase [Loigolactobacillus backii]ANK62289.1 NUDIX hydrolase [Loigolactobacillus backii]ANK65152.1 NUDIX hydrolase [Loigolactobacillus backii]ANK67711.1 NUDIX hydrolase [Loigolactobacillus backii]ANK70698.1 NUDIX hydrolase [Loigolactobacillus backii]
MTYKYTLAIVHAQEQILVINRLKKPYPGQWNGVGGKVEPHETADVAMQREIQEETQFRPNDYQLTLAGILDWHIDGRYIDSIYVYVAALTKAAPQKYPQMTREGILNFFSLDWLTQSANLGVVADFQQILRPALSGKKQRYNTNFIDERLVDFKVTPLIM